jgi:hypothetical protein
VSSEQVKFVAVSTETGENIVETIDGERKLSDVYSGASLLELLRANVDEFHQSVASLAAPAVDPIVKSNNNDNDDDNDENNDASKKSNAKELRLLIVHRFDRLRARDRYSKTDIIYVTLVECGTVVVGNTRTFCVLKTLMLFSMLIRSVVVWMGGVVGVVSELRYYERSVESASQGQVVGIRLTPFSGTRSVRIAVDQASSLCHNTTETDATGVGPSISQRVRHPWRAALGSLWRQRRASNLPDTRISVAAAPPVMGFLGIYRQSSRFNVMLISMFCFVVVVVVETRCLTGHVEFNRNISIICGGQKVSDSGRSMHFC